MRLKIRKFLFFSIFLFTLHVSRSTLSYADTIYMKDGKEVRGIVVEDYRDRLTFSTIDGEIRILKQDIREVSYDSEEDNLIKLAEQAKDRHNYGKAYAYYEMALSANPNSKAAKDGTVALQGYLYRKEEVNKEYDIKRRQEFESSGTVLGAAGADEASLKESVEKLKNSLGITIAMKEGFPEITAVTKGPAASEAGMKKGDILAAVWGRLTGYMTLKDVMDLLLEKPSIEIKLTIERTVTVDVRRKLIAGSPNDLIGASLAMEFDGLTIADVKKAGPSANAGLEKEDLIVAIDAKATRYMPLEKAEDLIKGSKGGSISLTVRRQLLIWRKD